VRFYDAFGSIADGTVSLMVEYMDGGSLQDLVDMVRRGRRRNRCAKRGSIRRRVRRRRRRWWTSLSLIY